MKHAVPKSFAEVDMLAQVGLGFLLSGGFVTIREVGVPGLQEIDGFSELEDVREMVMEGIRRGTTLTRNISMETSGAL